MGTETQFIKVYYFKIVYYKVKLNKSPDGDGNRFVLSSMIASSFLCG